MSQTPFNILSSTDILSAHINGLASSVNKLEAVLGLKTATVTAHPLGAVTDMEDIQLRYRIYEGTIRNWTTFTIKKNGVVVDPSEYVAHGGFGAIVFNVQQLDTDAITVDATYVTNESQVIEDIENKFPVYPSLQQPETYFTHSPNGFLINQMAHPVNAGVKNLDLFPYFVSTPITVDQMAVLYEKTGGGTFTRLGIYDSNIDGTPNQLVAETAQVPNPATDPAVGTNVILTGAFSSELSLQPGLYWLARWQDGDNYYWGLNFQDAYNLGHAFGTVSNASQFGGFRDYGFGGYRVTEDYTTTGLPTTLPALGAGAANLRRLERANFASPFIRRKA